jgi:hypothetical protein
VVRQVQKKKIPTLHLALLLILLWSENKNLSIKLGNDYHKRREMRKSGLKVFAALTALLILHTFSRGQDWETKEDELKISAPKVYLDGSGFDRNYIRTEITFVNYVRDRKEADIHILGTRQGTGASGREYLIEFIGQGGYEDIKFTLKYYSQRLDTSDETRAGLVRVLKKGLMPFVTKTPIEDSIEINYTDKPKPTAVEDKWNFWVFSFGTGLSLRGQESYKSNNYDGSFSINRTTEDLKFSTSFRANSNTSSYKVGDLDIDTSRSSWRFGSLLVKSVSDHWSVGAWAAADSSTYSNEDFSIQIAPAIEYNVFPYDESTRRKLTFLYRVDVGRHKYIEETIFDKTEETLFREALIITLRMKQPWGSISTSIQGSHYFHDFSKNRVRVYGSISLRLFKGLSLNWNGSFSMIHDQMSLVKGDLSQEEIILHLKELSTTYSYSLSFRLSYTFGSIYSNVVNPRFGAGGIYSP